MVLKVFRKFDYFSVTPDNTYSLDLIAFSALVSFLCSSLKLPLLTLQVEASIQIHRLNLFACCREGSSYYNFSLGLRIVYFQLEL